jgi:hypothetical protein
MTFEATLIALLNPLFANRVWFDTTPDGYSAAQMQAGPFCVVQQVGGDDRWYVDNTLYDMQNSLMDFTVWGPTREGVMEKIRALRKLLADSNSPTFIVLPQGAPVTDYNESLKLRGAHQKFGFWYPDPLAV